MTKKCQVFFDQDVKPQMKKVRAFGSVIICVICGQLFFGDFNDSRIRRSNICKVRVIMLKTPNLDVSAPFKA